MPQLAVVCISGITRTNLCNTRHDRLAVSLQESPVFSKRMFSFRSLRPFTERA